MKYFIVLGLLALLAVGQAQNDENETTTVDPSEDESSPDPPPPPPPPKRPGHGRPGHGRPERPEWLKPGFGFFESGHRAPLPRPLQQLRNVFTPVDPPAKSPEATNAEERVPVAFVFGSGKVKGESFNDYSSGHSFGGNTFGDTYGQGIVVRDKEETTSTTPGYYEYIYRK
ncbi:uncharacterized protein LOC101901138 [Musca domestica]|uniref:Uncharacterized protein LOC101901138 n=1 Tax=Musca domestica TaxID=7370 RepID=A0A9J7CSA6_MUSDO|nr:uncharacterized protein LOC101901138 [Musca domestica]